MVDVDAEEPARMQHRQPKTLVVPAPLTQHGRLVLTLAVMSTVLLALSFALGSGVAEAAPSTYSIWSSTTVPRVVADSDTASVEVGVRFRSSEAGWISAIRFYKSSANTGQHTGTLWATDGTVLSRTLFTSESTSGWQEAELSTPVRIDAEQDYVASYTAPQGGYSDDVGALSPRRPTVTNALTATQGVYTYAKGIPGSTWGASNYYVDVVFTSGTAAPPGSPSTSETSTGSPTTTTTDPTTTDTMTTDPTTTDPTTTDTTTSTSPSSTSSTSGSSATSPTTTRTTRPSTTTTTSPPTSPTTTAPSGSCAASAVWSNLADCGWPGPSNTGYPAGQAFSRTVTGGYVVTADNTVIDGWRVSGGVQVRAKNVTIRNSWVTSSFGGANGSGTVNVNPGASATIEHNLLDGQNATHSCIWHEGSSMTATANNCQGVNDGIFMWATTPGVDGTGDNFTIRDNYLHAFTTQAANGHVDGIQTEGARNGVIRHNTIDVTQDQNSAIAIWNGRKSTDNIMVDGNLIAGGGFAVYAEDYSPSEANPAGGYTLTNVTFTNNRFSTVHYACVGYWGVWFSRGAPSDGWRNTGNVVLETGQNIDKGNPTASGRVCN